MSWWVAFVSAWIHAGYVDVDVDVGVGEQVLVHVQTLSVWLFV